MTVSPASNGVIAPYGGTLVDLMVPAADQAAVKASATRTLECSDRNACDVELLVVGGFSPERGFMHQADYDAVADKTVHPGPHGTRRHQVQNGFLPVDDQGMTGVVPSLETNHCVCVFRQQINNFSLALVTPLGTEQNHVVGHMNL